MINHKHFKIIKTKLSLIISSQFPGRLDYFNRHKLIAIIGHIPVKLTISADF